MIILHSKSFPAIARIVQMEHSFCIYVRKIALNCQKLVIALVKPYKISIVRIWYQIFLQKIVVITKRINIQKELPNLDISNFNGGLRQFSFFVLITKRMKIYRTFENLLIDHQFVKQLLNCNVVFTSFQSWIFTLV